MSCANRHIRILGLSFLFIAGFLAGPAHALTRYVDAFSPSPGSPFTNWLTAAHEIQQAVEVLTVGTFSGRAPVAEHARPASELTAMFSEYCPLPNEPCGCWLRAR